MRIKAFFTVCLTLILFAAWAGAETPKAKVLMFVYPPFGTKAADGLAQQLIRAAFREQGYTAEYHMYPYQRAVYQFEKGTEYLFADVPKDSDIESNFDYVGIFAVRLVLVYLKDRYPLLKFNSLEDIKGKTVGVMLGTETIPLLKEAGLIVDDVPNDSVNIKKLVANRTDFWSSIDLTALHYIEKDFPERKSDFGMVQYFRYVVMLKVKKGSPAEENFKVFKKGFSAIKANGTYLKILEKFYGKGKVPDSAIVK